MDFPLNDKNIYISYEKPQNNDVQIEYDYYIIKFSTNLITLYFSTHVDITEYTITKISDNIFYLNWNENKSAIFSSVFLNLKTQIIETIKFLINTREIIIKSGKYTVLDENTFNNKPILCSNTENLQKEIKHDEEINIENKLSDEKPNYNIQKEDEFTEKINSNDISEIKTKQKLKKKDTNISI